MVDDIPQCFLYEDLLKKFFSSLRTAINHISPEQLNSLYTVGTINCGLSVCISIVQVSQTLLCARTIWSFQNAHAQAHPRPIAPTLKRASVPWMLLMYSQG